MKKIILLLLSTLMVLSLAACAGNSNNSSESSTKGSTPEVNTTAASTPTVSTPAASATVASKTEASTNENKTEPLNTSVNKPTDSQSNNSQPDNTKAGKKVLVAYFSATGTTKKLAEYASDAMSAELYEIVPKQPYTSADLNYSDKNSRSTKEMNDSNSRPAINGSVKNMADYDIVFIGYPIWWGEAPRIVNTFMESYDFSGKTVVTFSTSGGSGHNDRSIKSLATGANWITGTRLKSNSSRDDMVTWINGLGLDIKAK